ncbi:hypothetical protein JTE90_006194 [Oedothorax gibbosus]|uniref:Uncharacterized protein n=1 Tax=Oedothorax gibbosus TaxID=931172 RepID=A0AAV6VSQ9_9ARAC|nr:hypothetical protein JTE90_006194 [Oedothorax gibbosus]
MDTVLPNHRIEVKSIAMIREEPSLRCQTGPQYIISKTSVATEYDHNGNDQMNQGKTHVQSASYESFSMSLIYG